MATGLNADQVDGKSASDIAGGVSVGGVHVAADGHLTAAINRRGATPTVSRTGAGQYTVTFPGFTASGDALPQVTIIDAPVRPRARRHPEKAPSECSPRTSPVQPKIRGFALTLLTAP